MSQRSLQEHLTRLLKALQWMLSAFCFILCTHNPTLLQPCWDGGNQEVNQWVLASQQFFFFCTDICRKIGWTVPRYNSKIWHSEGWMKAFVKYCTYQELKTEILINPLNCPCCSDTFGGLLILWLYRLSKLLYIRIANPAHLYSMP